ncbi:MAG: hypothetical protein R3192_10015 [Woeseiaceae bacterium]|nr:hypothetical protein [Woeseiaceae bacterium]
MQKTTINKQLTTLAAIVMFGIASSAHAEVIDADKYGFTIRITTPVFAERMAVYQAAINHVGRWWHPDHTISGFAENMYIDAQVPGCFCERLGDGAGIVHLMVTYLSPGIVVRLTGGLGPLGLMGVNGNMTWEFDEADSGTLVTLNYAVGGYYDGGLDSIAPAVDGVLEEAMARLRVFAETGNPDEQE